MITRENYELFYMDYLEGDLEPSLVQELEAFLKEHPDLEVEEDFLNPLEAPNLSYENKNDLKFDKIPSFSKMNDEEKMIAFHEGILSASHQKELLILISNNPALQAQFDEYAQVFLKPNKSDLFESKSRLKKREAITMWPILMMVAASLLVFLFLNWNEDTNTRYANNFTISSDDLLEQLKTPQKGFQFTAKYDELKTNNSKKKNNPIRKTKEGTNTKSNKELIEYNLKPKKIQFEFSQQNQDLVAFHKVKLNTVETNEVRALHSESKMENVLPPVLNFAVKEISNNKVSLKKEENKKLFSGRVRFKIGSFEIAKN